MDKYKHRVSFRLEKRKDKSGNLPEELPINADMTMKYVKIPPPSTHISPSSFAYEVILMPAPYSKRLPADNLNEVLKIIIKGIQLLLELSSNCLSLLKKQFLDIWRTNSGTKKRGG